MINLRHTSPVLAEQHADFRAALTALPFSEEYLLPSPPGDYPTDRQVAGQWLAQPDYPIRADQVQLGGGGQHALTALLLATQLAGSVVATEPLTHPAFLSLAAQLGIKVAACAMDHEGLLPDALAALCRRTPVRAVYLMPTIHNPLGFVMPLTRRQQLVQVARDYDLLLLDDGAYGFLEPEPLPSFAHLAPERGCFLYHFSEVIAPGCKLSYIVAPPAYQVSLRSALRLTSGGASVLLARLVAHWMASGTLGQLIGRKQAEATRRQALLHRLVGDRLPYRARPTSFYAWVPLAGVPDLRALEQQLRTQGVELTTSLAYQADPQLPYAGVRVALGTMADEAALTQALAIVVPRLEPFGNRQPLGQLPAAPAARDHDLLVAVRDFLDQHYVTPPGLLELARRFGTNDFKLKKGFRALFGTTIFGYVAERRLAAAQRLLAQPEYSIQEVAEAVGFGNAAYFATAYRRRFGLTPSQARHRVGVLPMPTADLLLT